MFEAEIASKLPELKNREDYLTSCIFGAIKYLHPKDLLLPFISCSYNYYSGLTLKEYAYSLGIELLDPLNVRILFWPRSTIYGEPDIVLILQYKNGEYLIPIEIKFFSTKHGEAENDQLARYYHALATPEGRQSFSNKDINRFSGKILAFIYLTQFEGADEIQQSLKILESLGIKAHQQLFHLRWQQLAKIVFKRSVDEERSYEGGIFNDLKSLLIFKNLIPFSTFSNLPGELIRDSLLRIPVFFQSSVIDAEQTFKGFSIKPTMLQLCSDKKIFFGGS